MCPSLFIISSMLTTVVLDEEFLREVILHLSVCAPAWYDTNCPYVKATFLDLVSACGTHIVEYGMNETVTKVWDALMDAIGIQTERPFALSKRSADALFQGSFARVFFIDRIIIRPERIGSYLAKDYQNIGDALIMLGTEVSHNLATLADHTTDQKYQAPDTCSAALTLLHEVLQLKSIRGPVLQTSLILHEIYRLILTTRDPEVLSASQHVLSSGLSQPSMPHVVLPFVRDPDLFATLDKLESQCLYSAPSNAQSALHLLGFFLDWTYGNSPAHHQDLYPRIARYIRILRLTIVDTNPFDARFAAVNSICALHHIWTLPTASKATRSLLLGLATVLYDMLNDDDDEIRDAAALATTRLVNAHAAPRAPALVPAVPILTAHRLAAFFKTHFPTSIDLVKEGLRRLTDTPFRARLFGTPFEDTFAAAREEDTTLFATEKQNLFKDPTLDAVFWARVLGSVDFAAVSEDLRGALFRWVQSALKVFVETARKEKDGALGWTSKVEVFTLGMRVLCAADVVLTWETDAGSENAVVVRKLLVEFGQVGKESGVHGLWMEKVARVLERGVVTVMRRVARRLRAVGAGLRKAGEEKKNETAKDAEGAKKQTQTPDEQSVLNFLANLSARVRATEGGLMKKAGMP